MNGPLILRVRGQSGTASDDALYGVTIGIDGSAVMSGYTYGSWAATYQGWGDFVVMSMNADGTMLWKYQVGTTKGKTLKNTHRTYVRSVMRDFALIEKSDDSERKVDNNIFRC